MNPSLLSKDCQEQLDLAFFNQADYSQKQEEYFLIQYYHYIHNFPAMLIAALEKCQTDEQRLPLLKNLWEEHGEGDLNLSHRQMYIRDLERLGLEVEGAFFGAATRKYVEETLSYIKAAGINEALAFLSYGVEFVTPMLYQKILDTLIHHRKELEKEGSFFHFHIKHDAAHFQELAENVLFSHEAFWKALEIEKKFWNEIDKEMRRIG